MPDYTLHQSVLTPLQYADLWDYLSNKVVYTRIIGANMRCAKAFQADNRNNPEAQWLVGILKSTAIHTHLEFNDFVAIRYESGRDYVGWHTDGGFYMEPGCPIGSLSFGATRPIEFRAIGENDFRVQLLQPNSLLVMPSGFQERYEHSIPPYLTEELRIGIVLFTHKV